MADKPLSFPPSDQPKSEDRLESWKEIAAYLKREVRTVQRWEKTEGLPVRRHDHTKLASVFAYRWELDNWRTQRESIANDADLGESDSIDHTGQAVATNPDAESSAAAHGNLRTAPEPPEVHRWPTLRRFVAAAVIVVGVVVVALIFLHLRPLLPSKTVMVVLPFRSLGDEPAQVEFCKGLTEALTTQMGRLDPANFSVIAPTTAERIKDKPIDEIGRELGVRYVLEGTCQHSGNHARIDAQLIQTRDQILRRALSFSRSMDDLLALESEVAQAVVDDIQLTLSPIEQARLDNTGRISSDASEAYYNGVAAWYSRSPLGVIQSIDYFQQTVAKAPDFARGYVGLANAYSIASAVPTAAMPPRSVMPQAKDAALRALRIDPESAEAHAALGLVLQTYDWDLANAEQEYRRAFAINPSYGSARQWHAVMLMAQGHQEEALGELEQARRLDPLSPAIRASQIQSYYFARNYDQVVEQSRKALEQDPNFLTIHYHLGQALVAQRRYPEAISVFNNALNKSRRAPVFLMALGHAYALAGDKPGAMNCVNELDALSKKTYVPAIYFGGIYAGLGDTDTAMQWLNKAYDERTEYLLFMDVEPMSDPLRSDPQFSALVAKIKPS